MNAGNHVEDEVDAGDEDAIDYEEPCWRFQPAKEERSNLECANCFADRPAHDGRGFESWCAALEAHAKEMNLDLRKGESGDEADWNALLKCLWEDDMSPVDASDHLSSPGVCEDDE